MNNGIFIIAHAPLASALRECVAHVFPDRVGEVLALDVQSGDSAQHSLEVAQQAARQFGDAPVLLLTDVMGATPCNVARLLLAIELPPAVRSSINEACRQNRRGGRRFPS